MTDGIAQPGLGLARWPWDQSLRAMRALLRVAATRRALAELDERMLRDIGLSRAEALAEARRAPWDLGPRRSA